MAAILRVSICLVLLSGTLLSGCATLVSDRPVFGSDAFEGSDNLLGQYTEERSRTGKYYVDRSGPSGLRIVGMMQSGDNLEQQFYADGAAIALGGGDYVLQFSCVAYRSSGVWSAAQVGPVGSRYRHFTYYGLAMKDRMADAYWIVQNADGIGRNDEALFKRYHVEERKVATGEDKDKDTVDVLPSGISDAEARSFFRDAVASEMSGSGSPELVTHNHIGPNDYAESPEVTKAMTLTTQAACREVLNRGPRYEGK